MKNQSKINNYVLAVSFLLTTWTCARSNAEVQVLKKPVWAVCESNLTKTPKNVVTVKYQRQVNLVQIVALDLDKEILFANTRGDLLLESLKKSKNKTLNTHKLNDCDPLDIILIKR